MFENVKNTGSKRKNEFAMVVRTYIDLEICYKMKIHTYDKLTNDLNFPETNCNNSSINTSENDDIDTVLSGFILSQCQM